MKSSLRGTSVIALLTAAFSMACGKSPTEIFCAKGVECNLFEKGQTEAQCIADADKTTSALHNDPGCKDVAEKSDAVQECESALDCADLKDVESTYNKCKQQVDALNAARSMYAKMCAATGQ